MPRDLWLIHPEDAMCEAFRHRFAELPGVRVVRAGFEDLEPHDYFVTAGNAEFIAERQLSICYDGNRQVVR